MPVNKMRKQSLIIVLTVWIATIAAVDELELANYEKLSLGLDVQLDDGTRTDSNIDHLQNISSTKFIFFVGINLKSSTLETVIFRQF